MNEIGSFIGKVITRDKLTELVHIPLFPLSHEFSATVAPSPTMHFIGLWPYMHYEVIPSKFALLTAVETVLSQKTMYSLLNRI